MDGSEVSTAAVDFVVCVDVEEVVSEMVILLVLVVYMGVVETLDVGVVVVVDVIVVVL